MRKARLIGVLLGALVAIIAVALVSLWLLVDPNHFKDRIGAAVKQSTGRELTLQGDIKLSVFPWIALQLGPATLGNRPGFGPEPLLSFTHAAVRVKLLPLLKQRLDIARIEVDGLELRLARNPQGQANWENPASTAPNLRSQADTPARAMRIESLSNIRIAHGRVRYQDTVIENLELETGSVGGGRDVPLSLSLEATTGTPATEATLTGQFNLSMDADGSMRLAAVNLSGTVNRPGDGRPAHWEVSVPGLTLDLDRQTLSAAAFNVTYSNVHASGDLHITRLKDHLQAAGSVTLAPLVLHEFAPRLKIALPRTQDPKVLSELSGAFAFRYDAAGLALDHVQLTLDDTHLAGDILIASGPAPAATFHLSMDAIDLDRYRAPNGAPASPDRPADAATPAEKTQAWTAAGTLTFGAAHVAGMDLTQANVVIASHEGVTRLDPITAAVDGGRLAGQVTWDERGAVPTLSLNEQLTGVDLARLLAHGAAKGRASGRAQVAMTLSAHGLNSEQILKTLEGHVEASISEGAWAGLDLAYELGTAEALLDRQSPAPPANTQRTRFDTVKVTADLKGGVATTKDLTIASPVFTVLGQGSVNLPTRALNLNLTASLFKASHTTLIDIPLKISGTYEDPTVRPDVEALAKGQVKQKLKDILNKNGLEGLFK